MGGSDQVDKNVNKYRIGIHGKKWWWCLFTWIVDVAVQNAVRVKTESVPQNHRGTSKVYGTSNLHITI